ncbi:jg15502 [Pararge aegeria aegeria]|uniref:Jg15502 protein n=1 Tax=Pararge aegeria aegeria TaxID=348720 RepID=A0A8S4RD24_9NEOP|nr:jg15502 [Pararge aegeria aegeria]
MASASTIQEFAVALANGLDYCLQLTNGLIRCEALKFETSSRAENSDNPHRKHTSTCPLLLDVVEPWDSNKIKLKYTLFYCF